jgi:hypothetical protein
MAGVRSRYGIEPISTPKGLPVDISLVANLCSDSMGSNGHSHSWLSAEEIVELSNWIDEQKWPPQKGWGHLDEDEIFGYLEGNSFSGFIKYPESRPKHFDDVRFVFWFDN